MDNSLNIFENPVWEWMDSSIKAKLSMPVAVETREIGVQGHDVMILGPSYRLPLAPNCRTAFFPPFSFVGGGEEGGRAQVNEEQR